MKTALIMLTLASTIAAIHAADVNGLYDKHCASCHGKDGSGKTKMGQKSGVKDYRDPKMQAELKEDVALKQIKEGMSENGKEKMKPFKDKLSDDEIKALVAHIRSFKK